MGEGRRYKAVQAHSAYNGDIPKWEGKKVMFWIRFLILNQNCERQSDVMNYNKLTENVNSVLKRIATVNALAR